MDKSLTEPRSTEPKRIFLPILVLYKTRLCDSATYQTFVASSRQSLLDPVSIAVYDNSPIPQVNPDEETYLLAYKHDPANGGLAAAYNWALDIAKSKGIPWLLLLDQDSALPPEFLQSCLTQIILHQPDVDVVAIVPVIRSGGMVVSPMRVGFGRLMPLPNSCVGIQNTEISAFNSGSAIRCEFVRSTGGFNRAYWLDYLDHWLFHQIYVAGKRASVSPCVLDHNLSIQDYRHSVSTARYRSIVAAEAAFITTHKTKIEVPLYLFRLFIRSIRMFILGRRDVARLTMSTLLAISSHPMRSLEGGSE
jgi:glycosyltransferase involved in cell wall biosynthesis